MGTRGRTSLRKAVVYFVVCLSAYFILCLLIFIFQRSMIYPGTRESSIDPARAGFSTQRARDFSLQTQDGVRLGAWQVLPSSIKAGTEKEFLDHLRSGGFVFLCFHGNGGHRGHRGDRYTVLSSLGCHVLAVDYRGYGDSAGSPSEAGLALDAQAAWDWLTKDCGVPPERIILQGESLGCAVAIRLAQERSAAGAPPAGLVLEAPFTSMADVAAKHYWYLPARLILRETYPSLERIGTVTSPILVMHGKLDHVVPFEHGQRIFEAAPAASARGVPKRFVEFPRAYHSDLLESDGRSYTAALREFLASLPTEP